MYVTGSTPMMCKNLNRVHVEGPYTMFYPKKSVKRWNAEVQRHGTLSDNLPKKRTEYVSNSKDLKRSLTTLRTP